MKTRFKTFLAISAFATISPITMAEELPFEIGGHVRLNYSYRDWQEPALRDGLEFESLRLTVSGEYEKFSYKADYRWYENTDFNTVRYADLTYTHDEYVKVTAGITKVPFGLLPFASNSFWFSGNYYIGFEDDYDAGFVAEYERAGWSFQAGYFLNDEYNNAGKFGRYSFDIADDGEFRNQEDGQYNVRVNYTGTFIPRSLTEVGASYQHGDVLNLDTLNDGDMSAYAVHVRHIQGPVKLELQYTDYEYNLAVPEGQTADRLALSAYEAPFLIASAGKTYLSNLVYTLPYKFKSVSDIKCYSEYSRISPDIDAGRSSTQWVNGCSFGWSKLFVYVDSIQGKNMWFAGGSGIGLDFEDFPETTHRLNISVGVYF
ncbi:hypothetical protein CA267_004405 [Alteromonas pelagimontana]|uniref:Uncharacterized protein n=1 Tax=Alteromonas pelagimontana TaxID=1858656 RepID=A0A6M4MA79_9ALTE|nr:porin [Alteromonas pelagimontana]QJR80072.1 hypothetical protein CA267_004405 [Alteromonas pelagimontana]